MTKPPPPHVTEAHDYVAEEERERFRYRAPLPTKESGLTCRADQAPYRAKGAGRDRVMNAGDIGGT
jgi:hypothetical protein